MTFKKRIQALLLSLTLGGVVTAGLAASVTSPVTANQVKNAVKNSGKIVTVKDDPSTRLNIAGADTDFTATFVQSGYTDYCQSFRVSFKSKTNDYILGYYGEGEYNLPLSCSFDIKTVEGKIETRYFQTELTSKNNPYDGVGPDIGSDSLTLNFDITKNPGEIVDRDTFFIYNVFSAVREDNVYRPDLKKSYKISKIKTNYATVDNLDLSKYLQADLTKVSSFANFVSFEVKFNNEFDKLYAEQNADIVDDDKTLKDGIAKGKFGMFFNFPSMKDAFIRLQYKDGSVKEHMIKDDSTSLLLNAKKGTSKYRFVMKNIKTKHLERVSLCAVNFSAEYRTIETNKLYVGSNYQVRLGDLNFAAPKNDVTNVKHVNILLILVLILVAFSFAFAGIALGLYFYRKNKYKNDEFKRVNKKEFVKTSLNAYFASAIVFFDILFIAFRAGSFHNSLQVFNPLDNFIVVLSVASIIYVGYWIKIMIQTIKNIQTQKSMAALNKDTKEDDGTN